MWYEYLFSAWHAKTAARRDRDSSLLHDEEAQRRASTDEAAAGCLLRSCCMSDRPAPGEDFPGAGVGLGAGAAARLIRRVVQELNDIAIYISITASACTMCAALQWRSMMHHC
jgi:hypothetical protein